jgi:DNA polymerase elongation subunit (family B)
MLVDFEFKSNNLVVSYINDKGAIKMKYIPWKDPKKFVTCSHKDSNKHEQYITWDGRSVKEIDTNYPNRYSTYEYLDSLPEDEKKIIFDYQEPNIFFVDIENEILEKRPSPQLAEGVIQTISIVFNNQVMVMGLQDLSQPDQDGIKNDIENYFSKFNLKIEFKYKRYASEKHMIFDFFKMTQQMSVITGWNFVNYDWVYLVKRARKLNIKPEISSFTGNLRSSYDDDNFAELPAHRIVVDYMELYEKWDTAVKVKESSALDFVAEKLLKMKKVNYEGNLKILYRDDYKKFVFYNAVDSLLVQKIHEKMKYIDVLYGISTLSKIKALDAFSTLAVTEGILRLKLREKKNIILCKLNDPDGYIDPNIIETTSKMVKGGWVKNPFRGMKTWTCCYDFASLYPTTMRQFNISADSYKGQIDKSGKYSLFNGLKIPIEDNDIITLNGAVFKNEIGVVNEVMGDIYTERKKHKKVMLKANEDLNKLKHELEQLELEIGNL